jgi:hypothetical protein
MQRGVSIEELLRWRLAEAEADAPAPPRAAELLALARPWWERWPERFRAQAERLRAMPLAYGYAMTTRQRGSAGYPVPVLIAHATDVEAYAQVLYLAVRDGRLRLRFALGGTPPSATGSAESAFEATFVLDVPDAPERPPFHGRAERSQSGEYRVDALLPAELVERWTPLKVTDRMPFRLILRPAADAE